MLQVFLAILCGLAVTACAATDPPTSVRPGSADPSSRSPTSNVVSMADLPRKYYGAPLYWSDPPPPTEQYVTVAVNLYSRWGWQNVMKGHSYYDGRKYVRAPE